MRLCFSTRAPSSRTKSRPSWRRCARPSVPHQLRIQSTRRRGEPMKNRSKAVDAYIAKAAPFARPILETVRDHFHKACPDIEETTKWGFPHFQYKGIVGSMAAFKKHASFGFWKGQLMDDPHGLFKGVGSTSMAGMKIEDVSELP